MCCRAGSVVTKLFAAHVSFVTQVGEYTGKMTITRAQPACVKDMTLQYTLSGFVAASTVTVSADCRPRSKLELCHYINHAC